MSAAPHVIKIGGSLLSRRDARDAIDAWLTKVRAQHPGEHQVLIVGGGEPVEWLRRVDGQNSLGEAAAHWAAIAMMDAHSIAVSNWWPGVELVKDWKALQRRVARPGACLFAAGHFLRHKEPTLPGLSLPVSWQVTSDSIAARIAILLGARLTLLKSRELEFPTTIAAWKSLAQQGDVDAFFSQLVGELREIGFASPPARGEFTTST